MRNRLLVGGPAHRPIASAHAIVARRASQPSFAAMMRQQFGLVFGKLVELAFDGFSDAGVKRAARLAQQRAVGGVLHQRMFEHISRMRWEALPEQPAPPK